jgi:type I restriction enzyme S subunit
LPFYNISNIEISLPSIEQQQHIVDTIGSIDELIDKHSRFIEKSKKEMQLIFLKSSRGQIRRKLHPLIKFVKGKKPESSDKGRDYLTIDVLTEGSEGETSSSGVFCEETDVLMVMDGASSGRVFTGRSGYVGSTLAKIESNIPHVLLYLFLSSIEDTITKNTSGSAIPHADKGFIGEFEMPMITDEATIQGLTILLKSVIDSEKRKALLCQEKNILLKRYF